MPMAKKNASAFKMTSVHTVELSRDFITSSKLLDARQLNEPALPRESQNQKLKSKGPEKLPTAVPDPKPTPAGRRGATSPRNAAHFPEPGEAKHPQSPNTSRPLHPKRCRCAHLHARLPLATMPPPHALAANPDGGLQSWRCQSTEQSRRVN